MSVDLNRAEEIAARYTLTYRGYEIRLKRDFGGKFHLIDGMPALWGYVLCKGSVNACPGAGWFQTVKDAKRAADILEEADVTEFHRLYRMGPAWRFLQALQGGDPEFEQGWPLSWFKVILADMKARGPGADNDDPDAYHHAMEEGQNLLDELYSVIKITTA